MTILSIPAMLAMASKCLPVALVPIAVGIAQHENPALDTAAINYNKNGTTDYGLAQINSANFAWLSASLKTPINEKTITDPCLNLQASLRVLFARYNGNPPDAVKAAYAAGAYQRIAGIEPIVPPPEKKKGAPANPFTRPGAAGRDLVFISTGDKK